MKFLSNVIFSTFMFMLCSCTFRTDPGEGSKIGRIVKVSHQGMFFKTWEATLVRGGLNDGSGVIGRAFEFTIEEVQLIYDALGNLPANKVEVLRSKIVTEANRQMADTTNTD